MARRIVARYFQTIINYHELMFRLVAFSKTYPIWEWFRANGIPGSQHARSQGAPELLV
jgi:hypothetical protein